MPPDSNTAASAPNEQGYDFHEQVGHLLRRVYQRHTSIFQNESSDSQLTSIQFVTLCTLVDSGPCSLAEIVRTTAIDPATIRGVIKRLRARSLVVLSKDESDSRKVIASVTPTGDALVQEMIPHAKLITDLTFGPLNQTERVTLMLLLEKMLNAPLPAKKNITD